MQSFVSVCAACRKTIRETLAAAQTVRSNGIRYSAVFIEIK